MNLMLGVMLIAGALLALAGPAVAEHGQTPVRDSVDLNLDLKAGKDGFRLGGTLLGLEGLYGAWINGAVRPEGFSVDGRVKHPERSFDFKINADVGEWLGRSLRQVGPFGFPGPGDGV